MVMLWAASDWPLHDISEEYLYSAHMLQHMMLTYFLPPLVLLATPEWLLRVLIGNGRGYRVLAWLCRPVVAGVAFNAVVIVTHIPTVVNTSVDNGPMHYGLHLLGRHAVAADVDAGVRPVPRVPSAAARQVHLPVPPVGRADACRRRG